MKLKTTEELNKQGKKLVKLTTNVKVEDIEELYYELHDSNRKPIQKSGLFKEVLDFKKTFNTPYSKMDEQAYLDYHNFMYVPKVVNNE